MPVLRDGVYPFADSRVPLRDLMMADAPPALRDLLVRQSARNGREIPRNEVIELRCVMDAHPDATFVVFWPSGGTMQLLMPKASVRGRA